jgi:hypothetical protein
MTITEESPFSRRLCLVWLDDDDPPWKVSDFRLRAVGADVSSSSEMVIVIGAVELDELLATPDLVRGGWEPLTAVGTAGAAVTRSLRCVEDDARAVGGLVAGTGAGAEEEASFGSAYSCTQ